MFAGLICLIAANAIVVGGFSTDVAAQSSAEQELAERYAPVVMLRAQNADCDHDGEGYFPAPVDFLFDNPDIRLMANAGGDKKDDIVLAEGVTPQDLAAAPADTYLDFPGNPRKPGCTYETYFKEKVAELGIRPTTYAHIVVDPVARRLYVQYWFYYYFNHWNNTHESDWEMIQLVFEGTTSAEDALQFGPSGVAYAQHGGGELSNWNDEKLLKDGDRPVAFPSAGSHATYYGQHNFIGWGAGGTAFGCDDTTPPSVETPLDVIVVPDTIDPDSDLAFFLYDGHWGERDIAMFEGPKGPNLGGKWNDPSEAISNWRTSTLKVPDSGTGTINTTDTFCTLSAWGSKAVTKLGTNLPLLLGSILVLVAVMGFLCWRIWPYLAEAVDIYGDELRKFLGIGAAVIPVGFLGTLAVQYLTNAPPLEWVDQSVNGSTSGKVATSLFMGGLQQIAMVLIVTPAVIVAMNDIRAGRRPGVFRSYAGAVRSLPVTLPSLLVVLLAIVLGTLSIVLIPVMIFLVVKLQFFAQAAILDAKKPFTEALRESWNVTSGNWSSALAGGVLFQLAAIAPGPLIGLLVLVVGGSKVGFANFLSSFVYALTIPIATIGMTMLYHRFAGHEIVEGRDHHRPARHAAPGEGAGPMAADPHPSVSAS
ncbi:MAG: hypothetical protein AB7G88_05645 [Thermomicrobiales bacterium]